MANVIQNFTTRTSEINTFLTNTQIAENLSIFYFVYVSPKEKTNPSRNCHLLFVLIDIKSSV